MFDATAVARPADLTDLDWLDRRERPVAADVARPGAWRRFAARMQMGPVAGGASWLHADAVRRLPALRRLPE